MVIRYIHILKYFWFLIFFIVSFFSVYYFLKLIFEGSRFRNLFILGKTQQILKLKAECYSNFGSVQFVHVAQQMQNNNPEAFLTPLQFARPCRDNSLVEIVDKLWDNASFPVALLVLISALTLTIFISIKFSDLEVKARQLVRAYTDLEDANLLTNGDRWDFLMAHYDAGTWIFLVLDVAEKISYFVMLRAALQTCSRYYVGQYWNVILVLNEIAPLPFGWIGISSNG